ncbi:hypothetical protein [Amycolatopsis sp. NPDC051102]|uniref:hypothetical protein n=1 Tax=Amycolatopsis sp. NPDC051102 TaxID=3155163 RepID=UPI00341E42AE
MLDDDGVAGREHWATRIGQSVLVLAPHIVALARLEDLVPLIESDHRTMRVYAVPEDGEDRPDTAERIRTSGGVLLSMPEAGRGSHGLVLGASPRGLWDVRGPALMVSHGGGLGQYRPQRTETDGELVTSLDPTQLMRDGRVRPDRIALVHDREMQLLGEICPDAVPHAFVAGDIAFDRLLAAAEFRDQHRRALGVTDDQEILLVTSTWSPRSGFGHNPEMFRQIVDAAPGAKVIASLHPLIWSQHGVGQVLGWLSDAIEAGLDILVPYTDWRGAVAGADYVMADYTSIGTFAAGLGTPVLRLPHGPQPLLEGTPTAVLAQLTPGWDVSRPLLPQLHAAAEAQSRGLGARIAGLLTSRPGEAAKILREEMYALLGLGEPVRKVPLSPAPVPQRLSWPAIPLPRSRPGG